MRKTLVHELTAHCGIEMETGEAQTRGLIRRFVNEAAYDQLLERYARGLSQKEELLRTLFEDEMRPLEELGGVVGQGLTVREAIAALSEDEPGAMERIARRAVPEYMAVVLESKAHLVSGTRACESMESDVFGGDGEPERTLLRAGAVMGCVWAGGITIGEARRRWSNLDWGLDGETSMATVKVR